MENSWVRSTNDSWLMAFILHFQMVGNEYSNVGWEESVGRERRDKCAKDIWETGYWMHQGMCN